MNLQINWLFICDFKINKRENTAPQLQNISQINAEDDAAGLRKQLLRFHCISCDRPIEMNSGQVYVNLKIKLIRKKLYY